MNTGTEVASIEEQGVQIDMSKTVEVTISFNMGIGNVKKTKVTVVTDADTALLNHNKKLLDSPELEAIRSADGAIRRWLDTQAIASVSLNKKFLPLAMLSRVLARLNQYVTVERPELVDAFMAKYEQQVSQALTALGELGNSRDYANAAQVRAGFIARYNIITVSTPEALASVNAEVFEQERAKLQTDMQSAAAEVRDALRVSVTEMVDTLVRQLRPNAEGKRSKLYDTAVTNLQEFLNTFELRNITDDKQLASQMSKLKQLVSGVDADKLRESETLKSQVFAGVGEVSKALSTMTEVKGRKFR